MAAWSMSCELTDDLEFTTLHEKPWSLAESINKWESNESSEIKGKIATGTSAFIVFVDSGHAV